MPDWKKCLAGVTVALAASSARADIVDVNFYSAASGGGPLTLVDSSDDSTALELYYSADSATLSAITDTQPNPSLTNSYAFANYNQIRLTIDGLGADTPYDIYVYVASDDASSSENGVTVQANAAEGTASGDPQPTFIEGENYLLLTPTSDDSGSITLTENTSLANTSGEIVMNGIQINVPEPSSASVALILGVMLLTRRRRFAAR
jgi:hypothetical protein